MPENASQHVPVVAALSSFQEEIREWSARNFGKTVIRCDQPAILGLIEHVGELCHSILKFSQGIRGTPEDHNRDMKVAAGKVRALATFFENSNLGEVVTGQAADADIASLLGVVEEAGELASVVMTPTFSDEAATAKQADADDAVGDIEVYLLDFCARNGINAERAVDKTWHKVKQRDWLKNKKDGGENVVVRQ